MENKAKMMASATANKAQNQEPLLNKWEKPLLYKEDWLNTLGGTGNASESSNGVANRRPANGSI